MKSIISISFLLMMCFCSISIRGQEFNPSNPSEPGQAPYKLTLKVQPAGAGSVRGGGKYVQGSVCSLSVSSNTGYVFLNWTNEVGDVVGTSGSMKYTKQDCDEVLTANFEFRPGNPAEPTEINKAVYYRLTVVAEEGGAVSGGGRYQADKSVSLSASPNNGYDFVGWYDVNDELVSSARSFTYKTTTESKVLTARFCFNPSNPNEPTEPIQKHRITLASDEGGTVNYGTQRLEEGTSVNISANANSGYKFVGWYLENGELYTALSSFSYTIGKEDVKFIAYFDFTPSNPIEPARPTEKLYSFYMMNVVGKPGDILNFPVYLTGLDVVKDMTFRLTFPQYIYPDLNSIEVSEKASGYNVSCTPETDTTFVFSLIGSSLPAGNTLLLRFKITIPDTMQTGVSYPVKINQVSVTLPDDNTTTAHTRNGRIGIYKLGDTNGDNIANLMDKMNMITRLLGRETEVFIEEVSDTNEDGELDFLDAMRLIEIITIE